MDGKAINDNEAFTVVYSDGKDIQSALAAAQSADFTFIARGGVQGHEAMDRSVLTLNDVGMNAVTNAILDTVSREKLGLVVVVGEPVALEMYQEKFGAIILALEGGQTAGTAFADVVSGRTNPSGALPFTMYTAQFVNEVKMSVMDMRPDAVSGSKGRTYRFYTGRVVWSVLNMV